VDLYREIMLLVEQIPESMVSTYRAIAIALGDEIAESAIKKFLENRVSNVFPSVENSNRLFNEFETSFPLRELREEQLMLSSRVITHDDFEKMESVAGMDVAYSGDMAYGAYVEMDMNGNVAEVDVVRTTTSFPYIPTYFSYRELPVLEKLLKGKKVDAVMVDGNGVLHPRHFGIASHLGVLNSLPSIGIAKKLLCGHVKENYVYMGGEKVGAAHGKTKPIYISPGHKISVEGSLAIAKKFCKYRIPEPLRQAHILANEAKNENNL